MLRVVVVTHLARPRLELRDPVAELLQAVVDRFGALVVPGLRVAVAALLALLRAERTREKGERRHDEERNEGGADGGAEAARAAAAYLAQYDSAGRAEDADAYRARLATLDEVAQTTRAALHEAPYDPVINRYYLSALGAREVALRQLDAALVPAGARVVRY